MSEVQSAGYVTDMAGLVGLSEIDLGHEEWVEMTQEQVNQFADLTDDHNYIHVDPEAAKDSPFGTTISHGFFNLALLASATKRLVVSDAKTTVNYGLDKVRFPAPLPVGSRWRGAARLIETAEVKGGMQAKIVATLEVEGSERPAVVAESLIRFYA